MTISIAHLQPIIALIQGAAAGGGFALALAADIRIAARGARMNCAFIKLGLGGCEGLHLALAAPQLERLRAAMPLGGADRDDVVVGFDLLEADETSVGAAQQIEPVIGQFPPASTSVAIRKFA